MKTLVVSVAVTLTASACTGARTDPKVVDPGLPSSFAGQADDTSVVRMNWQEYFADPHLAMLIGAALTSNPDVFIALQRLELSRAGVRQSTGAMLPQVSAGAGVGVQKVGRYTPEGAGNASTEITPGQPVPASVADLSFGLQATWEIDAWGKLSNQRGAALARYFATVEGARLLITSLVAETAAAYYDLLALDHTEDVLAQTVTRQQEALEVVRLQKEAGRANELAVQQFEAQLATTQGLETETRMNLAEAENRVNLLLGRYPQPVNRVKEVLLKNVETALRVGVPSDLLVNRPDIRQAEQELRAAKCDLQAARAAFFPSVTLAAGIGFEAFNPKFLLMTPASLAYAASVGLVAPLVNRSAIEAEFDAAKASQIAAMYSYQKVILHAFVEVTNHLSSLRGSAEVIALKQHRKVALEQTVETADVLYRAGKATYFEVLIARQNTLSAELELIEALKAAHLARVRVYQALGGGWR